MKVKLYELLRMLCEDELRDGERVVINNHLYAIDKLRKRIFDLEKNFTLPLGFDYLNIKCELMDRK